MKNYTVRMDAPIELTVIAEDELQAKRMVQALGPTHGDFGYENDYRADIPLKFKSIEEIKEFPPDEDQIEEAKKLWDELKSDKYAELDMTWEEL